jgi:hypothetical protein
MDAIGCCSFLSSPSNTAECLVSLFTSIDAGMIYAAFVSIISVVAEERF